MIYINIFYNRHTASTSRYRGNRCVALDHSGLLLRSSKYNSYRQLGFEFEAVIKTFPFQAVSGTRFGSSVGRAPAILPAIGQKTFPFIPCSLHNHLKRAYFWLVGYSIYRSKSSATKQCCRSAAIVNGSGGRLRRVSVKLYR